MSNENSQNGTPMNATTADAPPLPTANGSSNGTASHTTATPVATAESPGESAEHVIAATAESSSRPSKKDKKRDRKKARDAQNAAAAEAAADVAAKAFPAATVTSPATTTEQPKPEAATGTEPPKLDAAAVTVGPDAQPDPRSVNAAQPPIPEQPATGAPPIATQEGGLRLRMKVWTDPETLKRYLVATAFMRDMLNGRPISDVMNAYAMSEEDTRVITLRVAEWNTLPFYYFQEDGLAPRASRRPVDRIG